MAFTSEEKRGSDCSLSDALPNRVLTLSNTSLTQSGGFNVYVNGLHLVLLTDYTVIHNAANSTITFLNVLFDSDYITAVYVQQGSPPDTGVYCNSDLVYQRTGLTSSEVSETDVISLILDAEAELEMITGRKFTNANTITEKISVKDKDIIGNSQSNFTVNHYPIQSVTSCNLVDMDGNITATLGGLTSIQIAAGTIDNSEYWLIQANDSLTNTPLPYGKFQLKTRTISSPATNIVQVTYTYGYSYVPQSILNLACCLAGIRVWLAFLGASYNRLNSYSIPQQTTNKGDFYQRGMQNIDLLTKEAEQLLDRIGRKSRTLFFASGEMR